MKLLVSVHFIIWVLTFIMSFQTINMVWFGLNSAYNQCRLDQSMLCICRMIVNDH